MHPWMIEVLAEDRRRQIQADAERWHLSRASPRPSLLSRLRRRTVAPPVAEPAAPTLTLVLPRDPEPAPIAPAPAVVPQPVLWSLVHRAPQQLVSGSTALEPVPEAACRVLLVSGSLRRGSTTAGVLRTAMDVAPEGVAPLHFEGLGSLPHFNPDRDRPPLDPAVQALRQQIAAADAVLFSTPEYAGALPGSFKNLLDWTIGDDSARSINGKPVAWINASPRGATGAHAELRRVLGYAGAVIVELACARIPVLPWMVDEDGRIADVGVRTAINRVLADLAEHVGADAVA